MHCVCVCKYVCVSLGDSCLRVVLKDKGELAGQVMIQAA